MVNQQPAAHCACQCDALRTYPGSSHYRRFIDDLLDDLTRHIDEGATTKGWLKFATHWTNRARDL